MILIVFVVILFIVACFAKIFMHVEERFIQNFDKVLDNKCRLMTGNQLNNYIGPWDGNKYNTTCSSYRCNMETCSFLERDTSLSKGYGSHYTWNVRNVPMIIQETSDGRINCLTNHGKENVDDATTINCMEIKQNAPDHNQIDFCFEYNKNDKIWEKKRYIKVLDNNGNYHWRQLGNMNLTKPEEEIKSCRKQAVDCSASNYYCCQMPGYPNPCYMRQPNVNDQRIEYIIDPSDDTGQRCITYDVCGAQTCYSSSDFVKNCWHFNTFDRKWENRMFTRRFVNGVCDFFDINGNRYTEDMITMGVCEDLQGMERPEFSDEKCAIDNSPITCNFMTDDEDVYSKTYQSKLDFDGKRCVYEALSGDDLLSSESTSPSSRDQVSSSYPQFLSRDALCPVLSPNNCKNKDHFLKMYYDESSSPKCMECPPDTYRNNKLYVYSESTACTPNATCTPVSDCTKTDPTCVQCLKRLDDDPHGNKFEIVYTQTIPNKSECVVDDDSFCEKKPNGEYVRCNPDKIVNFIEGGKQFCDNCADGYKLHVDGIGNVECKKTYNCTGGRKKCLNEDEITFTYHNHENETDEFSRCKWVDELTGNNMDVCLNSCPVNTYRIIDGGNDYCSQVLN